MNMKRGTRILIFALLAMVAAGCTKQLLQSTYDKQETQIESFVEARLKEDEKATLTRNGGAYRVTLADSLSHADSLDYGGTVKLYWACFVMSGTSISASNLVATNMKELAQSAGWELTDNGQYELETLTLDDCLIEGLRLGLHGVKEGDECYILFSGKYGFGKMKQGTIPARSALVYYVWIDSYSN